MFIVVEGPDCSGKSTIAQVLAARRGLACVENPPPPLACIKEAVLRDCAPPARLLYFLAGNVQAGVIARGHGASVVMVRYIWSTLAYYMAMEGTSWNELQPMVEAVMRDIHLPHAVVYLDVRREAQLARGDARGDEELQRRLMASDEFQQKLRSAYGAVRGVGRCRWINLDTSDVTCEQVVTRIEESLS